MNERRRFVVSGRVQGVGFRYFARRQAQRLGLAGWVRNLSDGRSVEAVAEGERSALDAFAAVLRQGPPGGYVASFETRDEPAEGLIVFDILP